MNETAVVTGRATLRGVDSSLEYTRCVATRARTRAIVRAKSESTGPRIISIHRLSHSFALVRMESGRKATGLPAKRKTAVGVVTEKVLFLRALCAQTPRLVNAPGGESRVPMQGIENTGVVVGVVACLPK